ncbi:MAG: rhamnogalacturonan acetylesterase [Porphyromonadaceae bacterium]|nr:rhamnogalacturonan acetylesterase [Porphyromonadaceae bacterium]
MKQILCTVLLLCTTAIYAQKSYRFDFTGTPSKGYIGVEATQAYNDTLGYGFDLDQFPSADGKSPFFFSVKVPDGNYKVTVKLGSAISEGETTVRAESRRLFIERQKTKAGKYVKESFIVNKRDTCISDTERVRINAREKNKFNWDDKLTLEFNGPAPRVAEVVIEPTTKPITVFLCGNSTVVDQDNEPWGSWGQMIPRFFTDKVAIANYAESGRAANTFLAERRFDKALTQMKSGDYVFVEFGHNDEKQKGAGKGPWTSFYTSLKEYIVKTREKGATIVFVTPTQRRSFGEDGKIEDTHGEFPVAMRKLAEEEGVPVIELNGMTKILYETLGVENSRRAFVQYPANTFPGQTEALEDNTHFNPYGAYQIAQCVLQGIKDNKLGLARYIKDFKGYDPAHPDAIETFVWDLSPFTEIEKPEGN